MTQVTVRPATLNDLEECVGMSIDFMNMTPYKDKPLCTQSLAKVFIKSVQDDLAFVAEDDGDYKEYKRRSQAQVDAEILGQNIYFYPELVKNFH